MFKLKNNFINSAVVFGFTLLSFAQLTSCSGIDSLRSIATVDSDSITDGTESMYENDEKKFDEIVPISMLEEKEDYLKSIDVSDSTLTFKRLGGTTPTNWAVKKEGNSIACLKCSSGNTNHNAAIAAYFLGKKLSFNIYPVAVPVRVDRSITDQKGTTQINKDCAMKEWAGKMTQYYWVRDTFITTDDSSKRALSKALRCSESENVDLDQVYNFDTNSQYGDPLINDAKTHFRGRTTLRRAVMDFSNMMLIDVLVGNNDRFPGGNIFFRTESGNVKINKERREVFYEDARFFSLDNEAGMKSLESNAKNDLKKYVFRFDESMIEKLSALRNELKQINPSNIPEEFFYLRFPVNNGKMKAIQLVIMNIDYILKHVEEQKTKCGKNVFF